MGNATRKERYDVDIQGDSAIEGGSVFYDGGDYFLRLDLGITVLRVWDDFRNFAFSR